jgi:hypothetical protein
LAEAATLLTCIGSSPIQILTLTMIILIVFLWNSSATPRRLWDTFFNCDNSLFMNHPVLPIYFTASSDSWKIRHRVMWRTAKYLTGKEAIVAQLSYDPCICLEGMRKARKTSVSRPRFQPRTSWTQVSCVNATPVYSVWIISPLFGAVQCMLRTVPVCTQTTTAKGSLKYCDVISVHLQSIEIHPYTPGDPFPAFDPCDVFLSICFVRF